MTTPSLPQRLMPLVAYGWIIGAIRYALDFATPDYAMYFGLYYLMPPALLYIGVTQKWGQVRLPQVVGRMVLLSFSTWFVWNSIAYVTGQFMGWQHGRFAPNRAAPLAEDLGGKIWGGVSTGFLTAVGGSVWCVAFGIVLIWLPAKVRAIRSAPPV